ncbi:MAG: 1-deoxy-D-xylulose-5-phosphate reductoisomerase [Oscillospiraceae bacterium]|nr:1-deoxy-D-xylulose-5-phosphate reductoisomerase [Oscillospiraceae bacterium]
MYNNIILLGSTGSIGRQTLDVCKMHGINVVALSANSRTRILEEQIKEFHPKYICITDMDAATAFEGKAAAYGCVLYKGKEGLVKLATLDTDAVVLNAIVGIAGLEATLNSIKSGKDVALANKESLVTGGKLVTDAVKKYGVKLLPVDSEHSAIFQCLQDKDSAKSLKKIILTASGGPFYGYTKEQLETVTKAQALKHPNWSMGAKITIDSATLMNKGLELIEAVWLFGLKAEDIKIVVHRQSIVHSAVQFADNSVIAQMGVPDMRIPIQYALTYPDRLESPAEELDFWNMSALTFGEADTDTFLCLKAATEAINKGGLYPCAVNGANERAVELFLKDKIKFTDIGRAVYKTVSAFDLPSDYTVEDVYKTDKMAREFVDSYFADEA